MTFPANFTIISDEISQDLPEVIRFVREFRLPGIELRSMFGRAFKDLTPADVAEIKRVAAGEGWKIFGCSSPVFKCEIDDAAAVKTGIEQFKRSIEVAHELGSDLIRVFTFLRKTPAENAAALPRIVTHLNQLAAIVGGAKLRIGVENESSCMVATGEEITRLFANLDNPVFGLVWDPCNVVYVPEAVMPPTTGFASFAKRVTHVHIKDAVRARSAISLTSMATPVGLGDVNWRAHLADIHRSGYRGLYSLETHWRVQQISEEMLHLPAGYAFSRGGEEASRTCLHNLREILPTA
jgi:L-ribulose-5-phosphate 3-epimerase